MKQTAESAPKKSAPRLPQTPQGFAGMQILAQLKASAFDWMRKRMSEQLRLFLKESGVTADEVGERLTPDQVVELKRLHKAYKNPEGEYRSERIVNQAFTTQNIAMLIGNDMAQRFELLLGTEPLLEGERDGVRIAQTWSRFHVLLEQGDLEGAADTMVTYAELYPQKTSPLFTLLQKGKQKLQEQGEAEEPEITPELEDHIDVCWSAAQIIISVQMDGEKRIKHVIDTRCFTSLEKAIALLEKAESAINNRYDAAKQHEGWTRDHLESAQVGTKSKEVEWVRQAEQRSQKYYRWQQYLKYQIGRCQHEAAMQKMATDENGDMGRLTAFMEIIQNAEELAKTHPKFVSRILQDDILKAIHGMQLAAKRSGEDVLRRTCGDGFLQQAYEGVLQGVKISLAIKEATQASVFVALDSLNPESEGYEDRVKECIFFSMRNAIQEKRFIDAALIGETMHTKLGRDGGYEAYVMGDSLGEREKITQWLSKKTKEDQLPKERLSVNGMRMMRGVYALLVEELRGAEGRKRTVALESVTSVIDVLLRNEVFFEEDVPQYGPLYAEAKIAQGHHLEALIIIFQMRNVETGQEGRAPVGRQLAKLYDQAIRGLEDEMETGGTAMHPSGLEYEISTILQGTEDAWKQNSGDQILAAFLMLMKSAKVTRK